jgi:hypothetical protein
MRGPKRATISLGSWRPPKFCCCSSWRVMPADRHVSALVGPRTWGGHTAPPPTDGGLAFIGTQAAGDAPNERLARGAKGRTGAEPGASNQHSPSQ